MTKAAFLDRDGTMLDDLGYLTPACEMRVFPWTADAVRLLNRAGFAVVVVTNQGGVARGRYTAQFVEETHCTLDRRFAAARAVIDSWQYCPHHPEACVAELRMSCTCRKPGRGMADAAAQALGPFDFARSWVVGDHWRDVQLGHAIGARSILIHRADERALPAWWPPHIAPPTTTCDTLIAAVAHIVAA
jgi:histidinol-phosphate phosphatase family protein